MSWPYVRRVEVFTHPDLQESIDTITGIVT